MKRKRPDQVSSSFAPLSAVFWCAELWFCSSFGNESSLDMNPEILNTTQARPSSLRAGKGRVAGLRCRICPKVFVSRYVLTVWLMLCGWSCCHICCCCTASCWDWSDDDRMLISGDTQLAEMIRPEKKKEKSNSFFRALWNHFFKYIHIRASSLSVPRLFPSLAWTGGKDIIYRLYFHF